MRRDPSIPLFLWVATALVVHAVGGGGATEVSRVLEEKADIRDFAQAVSRSARLSQSDVEVALLDPEEAVPEPEPPEEESQPNEETPPEKSEPKPEVEKPKPEPEAKKKELTPEEKKKKEEEKKKEPELDAQNEPAKKPPPVPLDNRRIAVVQHAKPDQEDNPNAKFAADEANHVEEETQARITSSDQNDPNPTPGGHFSGAHPEPGNANDARMAQSEAHRGDERLAPGSESGDDAKDQEARAALQARAESAASRSGGAPRTPEQQAASRATLPAPEVLTADGRSTESAAARAARLAPALRPKPSQRPTDLLGFGATGLTRNGVNLNLNHAAVASMLGQDELAKMRRRAGEKRLAQHRGSWTNLGLERWRASIENYVSTVKPGNQTALNTARVPFAAYLNQIHNRLHGIFADEFLGSLAGLPPNHPLSQQDMSTHVEIALSREDGRIVKIGVTKSSGVTMFDVGALEAVSKSAPFGTPPGAIVSSDGNVYLHWEFHRRPEYACSTYFARPFILNLGQTPATPRVEPPPPRNYDKQPADERSGQLESSPTLFPNPG